MSFTSYLTEALLARPEMRPRDIFKLCYQGARGAEHLLRDLSAARCYFDAEWDATPADGVVALVEPISDGFCRVNLGAWKAAGLPAKWLFDLFVATASTPVETDTLATLLEEADAAMSSLATRFSVEAWKTALAEYKAAGTPPIHHSEEYRAAYRPAYRVVSRRLARLIPILAAVNARPEGDEPYIIAIDGRAASGKSTAAEALARLLEASVIHMDDFFLPPALRTPERLAEIGGNLHYERFCEEVLPRLRRPEPFSYGIFDCGQMAMNGTRAVDATPIRIVEGSYAHHPAFGNYAHLRVFSTVDAEEQMARIRNRNGAWLAERFEKEWIPMEERYLAANAIRDRAHVIL